MPVAVEAEASQGGFAGGAGSVALTPVRPFPRGRRTAVFRIPRDIPFSLFLTVLLDADVITRHIPPR